MTDTDPNNSPVLKDNDVLKRFNATLASALLIVLALVVAAGVMTYTGGYSLYAEDGFMTLVAALTLSFTAFSSWISGLFSSQEKIRKWWYLCAIYFLYLSFDEMLQLHENGGLIAGLFFLLARQDLGISLAEALTMSVYAVVAILLGVKLRAAFANDRQASRLVIAAIVMIIVSLAVDMYFWPFITVSIEDGTKQMGYFFLLAAFLRQAVHSTLLGKNK